MITKISDKKRTIEVGKNNVAYITPWSVDKDVVDIYRVADADNCVIEFKGYINKKYKIEHDSKAAVTKPEQMTLF